MAPFINDGQFMISLKGCYREIASGIILAATNEQTFHNSTSK